MDRIHAHGCRTGRQRQPWIRPGCVFAGIVLLLALTSCPNPLPINLALQTTDTDGPVIVLTVPGVEAVYQSTGTVSGRVTDPDGEILSVRLVVQALEIEEDVALGTDGTFEHTFSTVGATTTLTATLVATDWNGNESSESVVLENDLAGPHILITEPVDFSTFSTVVRVSGQVADAADVETIEEVSTAAYEVTGTSLAGDLVLEEDGSFSFEFATRLEDGTVVLDGSTVIRISATDWNGNTTTETVTVVPAATGNVSGFTVTPSNKSVTVEWDDVLYAESYTIYEAKYGQTQPGATSPFPWTGLDNGEAYRFQVRAHLPEPYQDAYSSQVEKMPLSPLSFAPRQIASAYRSISLEWWDNPYVEEYTVERAPSPNGPWEVRRILTDAVFMDELLDHDTAYYYRVTPTAFPEIPSGWGVGVPGRFGPNLTTITLNGMALAAVVDAQYAYVACDGMSFDAQLAIIDVSDPLNPGAPVFTHTTRATDLAVADGYAYVAAMHMGLAIIDVRNPAQPGTASYLTTNDYVRSVAVHGSYAYISDDDGFCIVDISNPLDPGDPVYVPDLTHTAGRAAVAVSGLNTYAYVPYRRAGLHPSLAVVDVTNPTTPAIVAYEDLSEYPYGGVRVVGDHALLGTVDYGSFPDYIPSYVLQVVDISTPTNPVAGASVPIDEDISEIWIEGNTAYIAAGNAGLALVDITTPSSPGLPEYLDTASNARSVSAVGSVLFVSESLSGLSVIDTAEPTSPSAPVYVTPLYEGEEVVTVGDVAIFADLMGHLTLYDVSDPLSATLISRAETGGSPRGVVVSGGYAFVAVSDPMAPLDGLSVIDISTPASPGAPATLATAGQAEGLDISGAYVYLANDDAGLAIVDVSDPLNPGSPVYIDAGEDIVDVRVVGPYAYCADSSSGLSIVDISDPASPKVVGTEDPAAPASSVAVEGRGALVADYSNGAAVVNVSTVLGSVSRAYPVTPQGGDTMDTAIVGPYGFVADGFNGVFVMDISDPAAPGDPLLLASPTEWAAGCAVSGSYLYMADGDAGLAVIDLFTGD